MTVVQQVGKELPDGRAVDRLGLRLAELFGPGKGRIDIILGIEAMGLPLASTLSLSTGKPLVIARKRAYGLPGEIAVDQETGYSKGTIYLNDIHEGERVFVVDDVVSTGGTLEALLKAVEWAGATVADVVVVFEKNEGMQDLLKRYDWPIRSLMRVEMDGEKVVLLD